MKKKNLRLGALIAVNVIAAYLSLKSLGGFLVFGVGNSFGTFSLFAVPVLALPIALIAWWKCTLCGVSLGICYVAVFWGASGSCLARCISSGPQWHSFLSLFCWMYLIAMGLPFQKFPEQAGPIKRKV
jgi:hypothetical protein